MVKILKAIISWFEDSDRAALDRYLGQAQNYAELEDRMRKWQSNSRRTFV
jgi:hypothetical protein